MNTPFTNDDVLEIEGLTSSRRKFSPPTSSLIYKRETYTYHFSPVALSPGHTPPAPYGVKGGVARTALIKLLLGVGSEPRDIDLVRIGSYRTNQDLEIARSYMPEDFKHGAQVELVQRLDRYMHSRDLTLNEVMVLGDELICSPFALLDVISRTLRPSRYRSGSLSREPQLAGNVLLKMVRLRAEWCVDGENWRIVGVPQDVEFSERDLAIHLEKALQRSPSIAEKFLSHLVELGFLDYERGPFLPLLIEELSHFAVGETGILKSIPEEFMHLCQGGSPYSNNWT